RGDPLHRPAARREALRRVVPWQRAARPDRLSGPADGIAPHRRPGDRWPRDRRDRRRLPRRTGAPRAHPVGPAGAGIRAQQRRTDARGKSPMTAIPFIDLKAQQARIATELRRRIDGVLAHCQFILGPEVAELEAALAGFCGAKHCVAVSSGTDAIQIAFMAEGIGPGDAVFLPAFTYTATAEVPLLLGATPAFVDVDPRTFPSDSPH